MAEEMREQDLPPDRIRSLDSAQLVDVRTTAEYETSRIEGARHLPLDRLHEALEELDPERPVVFYCRTGERSSMAAAAFRASGWQAYNLAGGLVVWVEQGFPVEPEGAAVAQHSSIPDC